MCRGNDGRASHGAVRRLDAAAVGGNVDDLSTRLQMAFQLERIEDR
jgi:hypothetical protein